MKEKHGEEKEILREGVPDIDLVVSRIAI